MPIAAYAVTKFVTRAKNSPQRKFNWSFWEELWINKYCWKFNVYGHLFAKAQLLVARVLLQINLLLLGLRYSKCWFSLNKKKYSQKKSYNFMILSGTGLGRYVVYSYADACRTEYDERTQFFTKIYLSLYLKGFERVTKGIIVWEVSWRLKRTAEYWPPLFWPSRPFFPVLLGCSTGGLGAKPLLGQGSHFSIFSPTAWLSVSPRVISLFYVHSIQPVDSQSYPLTSSTGCTCYLHRGISSVDSLAGVNMQQIFTFDSLTKI